MLIDDIQEMLKTSPVIEKYNETPEEWAIHDYENFGDINISEYEDLERVSTVANNILEHGEAYAAFVSQYGEDSADKFEENYQGCYKSEKDFAYELYEQQGTIETLEKAGLRKSYIDFDAIAHDLFINDYTSLRKGYEEYFIFSDY